MLRLFPLDHGAFAFCALAKISIFSKYFGFMYCAGTVNRCFGECDLLPVLRLRYLDLERDRDGERDLLESCEERADFAW